MQARVLSRSPEASIKVVIAYDELETARRAEGVYERLAGRLGESFEFQQRLWRFDVLEEEGLRAEAVRDAVNADIVIVAMKDDTQLPEAVRRWLEGSVARNSSAAALVALLQRSGAPVQPYLEDVARRGGMDFFAQSDERARVPTLPVRLPGSAPSFLNN
jgi:hypothetical protein